MFRETDLFNFFRWVLCIIGTIYVTVITLQSLWGWYVWFQGPDKFITLARRYVLLHGLRLRFKTFWGDVIICLLLCIAFLLMWRLHGFIYAKQV
jgi:hypothetical protein